MSSLEDVTLYKAGQCNIGFYNRLFRAGYGVFFLALSFWLWTSFLISGYGVLAKAMLIVPLYVGFLGLYQGVLSFCVHHAKHRSYDMR